jgi:proteasome activator subunit 4
MIFSEELVRTFVHFLTHDSIGLRMISFRVVGYIIYLQRRVYKDTLLDPSTFPEDGPGAPVGERPSNLWMQYRSDNLPDTEERYNSCVFVDKPHMGYNRWSKQVKVCIEIDNEIDNTDRYSSIDSIIVSW